MKHPLATARLALGLICVLGVVAIGCSSAPQVQLDPKPLPPGVSFQGEWYSPQYENMVIEQKGSVVTGTFSYKEGGSFEGRADGDTLTFTWIQEGNKTTAVSGAEGSGYFVLSPDGKRLEGEWGYGDLLTGGGSWTAERIQKDRGEAFDPDAPIFNN